MTIQFFSDQLRESLNKKLVEFNPDTDDLFRLGALLTIMREALRELKEFATRYSFSNEQEEIFFFKNIKPSFMAEYFYYKKAFALRLFDAFRDGKARQLNYQAELKKLESFAAHNKEFFEYCMTGSSDLDRQYFLRGRNDHESLDRDEKFSTGFDTRLSRIRGNELIRLHILRKSNETMQTAITFELNWTESKTALIELIYALHASKAFNQGSVDIKAIASAFETCFNISLGSYYRVFQDIRMRKGSSTSFLDQLRKSLQAHIDSFDN